MDGLMDRQTDKQRERPGKNESQKLATKNGMQQRRKGGKKKQGKNKKIKTCENGIKKSI
jgi:hypothetical protein